VWRGGDEGMEDPYLQDPLWCHKPIRFATSYHGPHQPRNQPLLQGYRFCKQVQVMCTVMVLRLEASTFLVNDVVVRLPRSL
jgi:hypothetical protein